MKKILSFLLIFVCISCSSKTAITETAVTKTENNSVVDELYGLDEVSYTTYAEYVKKARESNIDNSTPSASNVDYSNKEAPNTYQPKTYYTKGFDSKTDDMILIYYGNKNRPKWGKTELVDLVMHKFEDGHKEWLYPSFLFLEFKNDEGYKFGDNQPGENGAANQKHWEWLLNRYFSTAYNGGDFEGLKALDQCIEDCKRILGNPNFRHKVYLSVPSPCTDFSEWGAIKRNGKSIKLDFRNRNHRLEAVKWFIDELIHRFETQHYKNITLEGVYWIEETTSMTTWHKDKRTGEWTNKTGEKYNFIYENKTRKYNDIISDISQYIHSQGLNFYWIPFNGAYGNEKWRTLGFDRCDIQTGYFWGTPDLLRGSKSLKTMSDANSICNRAINDGIGVEFEKSTDLFVPCYGKRKKKQDIERPYEIMKVASCNKKPREMEALGYIRYDYNPCLLERLKNLMTIFESQGVFERCNISYYEGYMIRKLCCSNNKEIIRIADRLARHISQRNKR